MTHGPGKPLRVTPELKVLVELFHPSLGVLGQFQEVTEDELPAVARKLLWHDAHMTVTLEAHYDCQMDVEVVDTLVTSTHYARHVLLRCQKARRVVQYGIVRLNLAFLQDDVRREIESQQIPLGRVLIEHDVLRTVRLLSLWNISPGLTLRRILGLSAFEHCYGRTALIYCNEVPALELLEIVTSR
jgi:chorismate-pyruvate lyase